MSYNVSLGLFKNYTKLYKKPPPSPFMEDILNFFENLAIQHIGKRHYMTKIIKIPIKYIK